MSLLPRLTKKWSSNSSPISTTPDDTHLAIPESVPDSKPSEVPSPTTIAQKWLSAFQDACLAVSSKPDSSEPIKKVLDLFLPDGWWRDKLCLTWDFHTREGVSQIESFISENQALAKAGIKDCVIDISTGLGGPVKSKDHNPAGLLIDIITFMFRFKCTLPAGSGRGIVKLSPETSSPAIWKAHVLFTGLDGLDGYAEKSERPLGHYEGHTRSWASVRSQELRNAIEDPTVLIVGGAQAGLITAARMIKLGLRVLVIEKTRRVGDSWRDRYDMLTLHTSNAWSQLPYQPFPKSMPEFIPKDKIADFLEYFSIFQDIPVLTSAEMLPHPTYDEGTKRWTVQVRHDGTIIKVRPKHLVLAIGALGEANMPHIENMDVFRGPIYHADKHKNSDGFKGKKVVIVGPGVTGTDIALEADEAGAEVLLVQRSPVPVARLSNARKGFDRVYPPERPTEDSDWLREATPWNYFMRLCSNVLVPASEVEEKELHDGLRSKGFLIGWGEEGGRGRIGPIGLVYTKLGGFCVDVGCADRIVDGRIKLKAGVEVKSFEPNAVIFSDGTRTEADIVIFATGYIPMSSTVARLLGPNILAEPPKIWDLDEEGEINGAFRETGHPGLWYAIGGFAECRSSSKFLALRILAEELNWLEK